MFIRCFKYTAPAKSQLRHLFRIVLRTLLRFRIHKAELNVLALLAALGTNRGLCSRILFVRLEFLKELSHILCVEPQLYLFTCDQVQVKFQFYVSQISADTCFMLFYKKRYYEMKNGHHSFTVSQNPRLYNYKGGRKGLAQ